MCAPLDVSRRLRLNAWPDNEAAVVCASSPSVAPMVSERPFANTRTGGAAAGIDRIRNGAVAYLHPLDGAPVPSEAIPLTGSFAAIGGALYYCAPRVPPPPASSSASSSGR